MSQPRLLVLNEYYTPGVEATAQLLTDLCEALTDSFEVTVVTGHGAAEEGVMSDTPSMRAHQTRAPSNAMATGELGRSAMSIAAPGVWVGSMT